MAPETSFRTSKYRPDPVKLPEAKSGFKTSNFEKLLFRSLHFCLFGMPRGFFQHIFSPPIGPPLAGFGRYFGVQKLVFEATFWALLGSGGEQIPQDSQTRFEQTLVFVQSPCLRGRLKGGLARRGVGNTASRHDSGRHWPDSDDALAFDGCFLVHILAKSWPQAAPKCTRKKNEFTPGWSIHY